MPKTKPGPWVNLRPFFDNCTNFAQDFLNRLENSIFFFFKTSYPMFVDRKVRYSALFTNLVGWHTGTVSFPKVTSF